jgi:penicillin-binding protein 1A
VNQPAVVIRFARRAGIVALFLVAATAGTLSGVLFAYAGDLPQISALDDYAPSTITRVYAADGSPIGDFAVQRRLVIGYDDIPPVFREAIIASEDAGFDSHFGLSISAIAFRLTRDVLEAAESVVTGRPSRPAGASTLTQQLARNLFPQTVGFQLGDVSIERKIKEAIVAMQIEKRFTKREILTFYANQMLFGHGTYGVEAAALLYFGKSAKDLTLDEAALLAGLVQLPARQSPYVNMDAATRRRAYVLQRMADEGYITQADADAAKERPIVTHGQPNQPPGIAPYFVEEIRKHLEETYGAKALYESGLSVTTTLDVRLQRAANAAIENGLRRYDKRRGVYRRPLRNIVGEGHTVENFADERWRRPIVQNDVVPAVVVDAPKTGAAKVRVGRFEVDLAREGFAWTRRASAAELFKPGDLIDVRVARVDESGSVTAVTLEQTPVAEAALVAIDNRTGQIRAMVGGWSFARSKFNRAVQAYRQIGSTFKPVVYTAAIDRGFTPASMIVDEPTTFPAGPNQPDYAPQNYDHTFEGPITLRRALEDSRNIPAVKMMAELDPKNVLQYATRFGFDDKLPPYLSIALGAGDGTLLQVTSAYTVFPNRGVRMKPFDVIKVQDRDGNLLEENRSEPIGVIRADTAFVMTNLLRGVVQQGTAGAAASIDWPLAGKTGTVDDNTDAWFIGFDPDITVGVWVGLDEKKPLGANETGAVAALPIWMDFMKAYIDGRPDKDAPPAFEPPANIVFLSVDQSSGAILPPGSGGVYEAFIAGTQPGGLSREP